MKNSLEILEIKKETISVLNDIEPNVIMGEARMATWTTLITRSSTKCLHAIALLIDMAIGIFLYEGKPQKSDGGILSGNSCVSCAVWAEDHNVCMIAEVQICG